MNIDSTSNLKSSQSKLKGRMINYIKQAIPFCLYGLSGSGKSKFINEVIEGSDSTVLNISFNDFINDDSFYQLLFKSFTRISKFCLVQEVIHSQMEIDDQEGVSVVDAYDKLIISNGKKSSNRENLIALNEKLHYIQPQSCITIIFDEINDIKHFNAHLDKIEQFVNIWHTANNQGIGFVSSFRINSHFSSKLASLKLAEIKYSYELPIDIIENEVLGFVRIADSNSSKSTSKEISSFKKKAFAGLSYHIFNYNEYLYFFKNFTEFFSKLNSKDYDKHFSLYLEGSCFHINQDYTQDTTKSDIKFDIYKDLIDFSKDEMVKMMSYNQKILLIATLIGICNKEEYDVKYFEDSCPLKKPKSRKINKNHNLAAHQYTHQEVAVKLQRVIGIYFYLKLREHQHVNFNRYSQKFSEFYVNDKNIEFLGDVRLFYLIMGLVAFLASFFG